MTTQSNLALVLGAGGGIGGEIGRQLRDAGWFHLGTRRCNEPRGRAPCG
jgi:NAD(P)-dependent dehydrogenase (short-subunit alcohol dehydrogenase family)